MELVPRSLFDASETEKFCRRWVLTRPISVHHGQSRRKTVLSYTERISVVLPP